MLVWWLVVLLAVGGQATGDDPKLWSPSHVRQWLSENGFENFLDWFRGVNGKAFLLYKEHQLIDRMGWGPGTALYNMIEDLKTSDKNSWAGAPDLVFDMTWEVDLDEVPEVSIVIAFFNQPAATRKCLESLSTNLPKDVAVEVILVNDCSTDEVAVDTMLRGVSGTAFNHIRNPRNLGFLRTANVGAQAAKGKKIVFLNNDAEVQAGWLEALLGAMELPRVGMVVSKLVYPDNSLQEAGGIIMSDGSGINYGKGGEPDELRFNYLRDVDYGSGAAVMIHTSLLRDIGYFDDRYAPAYYEDTDVAFSVRLKGYRVVYQPKAVVIHHEGLTNGRNESDKGSIKQYQVVNKERFVDKWRGVLRRDHFPPNAHPDVAKDFVGQDNLHVLVLDYATPRPDKDSGSLRMFHMLGSFRDTGCHVTFRPRLYDYLEYAALLMERGIEFISVQGYHEMIERGSQYDVVVISRRDDFNEMYDVVKKDFPSAYIVYDTVDLHYIREEREAVLENREPDTSKKELELSLMRKADLTLVVSSYELKELSEHYPESNYDLLSNIHTEKPSTVPFAPRQTKMKIMFTGNYHHGPNVDAMEWYVDNVHDIVRRHLPHYELHIVGTPLTNFEAKSWLPERLQKMTDKGIIVRGFVADMTPLFNEMLMTIAPLRYGAGVKGKVSQSLAYGVPVVTSSIGAEGMSIKHNEHCLVGSITDPEHFAAQITLLAQDQVLWKKLRDNGLKIVKENFSVQAASKAVNRILAHAKAKKKEVPLLKMKSQKDHTVTFIPINRKPKHRMAAFLAFVATLGFVAFLVCYGFTRARHRKNCMKSIGRVWRRFTRAKKH